MITVFVAPVSQIAKNFLCIISFGGAKGRLEGLGGKYALETETSFIKTFDSLLYFEVKQRCSIGIEFSYTKATLEWYVWL